MIYTNLDYDNMVNEIKTHLKSVKNKNYIKNVLEEHLKYNLINKKQYNELKEYYKKTRN